MPSPCEKGVSPHEWRLISEHRTYDLEATRRFYCIHCRRVVEDKEH